MIISSHILHEVDLISDQVILLNEGYVVAEGDIRGVRSEIEQAPDPDPGPLRPAGAAGRARLRRTTLSRSRSTTTGGGC